MSDFQEIIDSMRESAENMREATESIDEANRLIQERFMAEGERRFLDQYDHEPPSK